jgi:ribose 5-phosphate isomerase A
MDEKRLVGERAVEFVKDGMVVGLGTGSTVYYTLLKLGELVQEGLNIRGVPTSVQTEKIAIELGIPLIDYDEKTHIDVAIDGADEVDADLDLIKGGGGALLREKIVANAADLFVVVATPPKLVNRLGDFGLPIEVIPFGIELTMRAIEKTGLKPRMRQEENRQFLTDQNNYIVDCAVPSKVDLKELEMQLNRIPGIVEHGLFVEMMDVLVTLDNEGETILEER